MVNCKFFCLFFIPISWKDFELVSHLQKKEKIKNNDYVSKDTFCHNKIFFFHSFLLLHFYNQFHEDGNYLKSLSF